jgi:predicted enzyme related to lactoylglutathione lyase
VTHFEISTNDPEKWGKILMQKQTIPGVGYFTYCKDPQGNAFAVLEPDSSAK